MSTASLDQPLFSASVSFGCAVSPASGLLERLVRSRLRSLWFLLVRFCQGQRVYHQAISELGAANE